MPQFTPDKDDSGLRLTARMIAELDDHSIQLLLRETLLDTLLDFLWYLRDAALIKRVLGNMSERAGEMLMQELESQWAGKNPDTSPAAFASRGRTAVQAVMRDLRKLIEEGLVPDVLRDGACSASGEVAPPRGAGRLDQAVDRFVASLGGNTSPPIC